MSRERERIADETDLAVFRAINKMNVLLDSGRIPEREMRFIHDAMDACSKARHYGIRPLMNPARRKETA